MHKRKKVIRTDDIMMCEADGKYSKIITAGGKEWMISQHLGELESQLSDRLFCRVHRKYLINLNYLTEIETNGGCRITLTNNICIPVSHRRRKKVMDTLNRFFNA